jgi:prepilin-type N-terminal cleavage/methylation domain-containing protein/prepilin-type processing-associated H-X9-DG protein
MKKAFTLIELLVVIAIIAILAAILFPVFAQAKMAAKKTADLSNQKQFATATFLYSGDYEDTFFTQGGKRCNGAWSFNTRVLVPADWNAQFNAEGCNNRVNGALGLPNNLVMPYVKSAAMMSLPGVSTDPVDVGTTPTSPNDKPYTSVGYNFNGLLSSFSTTGVVSPATTPTWWSGFGATNRPGTSYSHPYLICNDPNAPCVFNGGGPALVSDPASCPYNDDTNNSPGALAPGSQSGVGSGVFKTVFIYGKGMNWAFADGHAKWRTLGTLDPKTDPFSKYDAKGVPVNNAARKDAQCHVTLFRPDYQP